MVTLRCTGKLLKRLRQPVPEDLLSATTTLGDWYANPISLPFPGRTLLLFVNEPTRLAVVLPGRGSSKHLSQFQGRIVTLLRHLGISEELVTLEAKAMEEVQLAKTASRSVLGSMNEIWNQIWWSAQLKRDYESLNLVELELELSRLLHGPLGYKNPAERVKELFYPRGSP